MKALGLIVKLIAFAPLLVSASVSALQVDLTCYAKAWVCYGGTNGTNCAWQTLSPNYPARLQLVRDANSPTTEYPYQVYYSRYQTAVDNHFLTLDIYYSDRDLNRPMKVYANLNAGSVMAESSGTDQIDVALRNNTFGRGFICTNFQLVQ